MEFTPQKFSAQLVQHLSSSLLQNIKQGIIQEVALLHNLLHIVSLGNSRLQDSGEGASDGVGIGRIDEVGKGRSDEVGIGEIDGDVGQISVLLLSGHP